MKGTCPGRPIGVELGELRQAAADCPCDGLYSAGMEKSMATAAVNAVVGVSLEEFCFFEALFLAKPRRRKERQQKVSLCASAAWRETVFRFSVVSVSGVYQE